VPSSGELLTRLGRAIEDLDADLALATAREMGYVGLYDALRLCRMLARAGDPRYERAAVRWMLRLESETDASLPELELAAVGLGVLARAPQSEQAWDALAALVSG
jgi:hypothetical protein